MNLQVRSQSLSILAILITMVSLANGHGRLRDPPSRSSLWREGFKTPPDYNDTEGFCGGYERQWLVNKGKCGICGDPFDEAVKPHEAPGGVFATGIITRTYTEGQIIPVKIDITALHKGYYEFRLCVNNNVKQDPSQDCFSHVLPFANGAPFTKYNVASLTSGVDFNTRLQLPPGITCSQCILQWTYTTGNRWGTCSNGTGSLGCGPQETFRACSDVRILPRGGLSTSTPTSETVSPTMTPMTPMTSITTEPAVTASTMTPTIPATAIMTTEAPVTVTQIPMMTRPTQIPMMTRPTQLPTTILPPIVVTPSGDCTSYIAVPSQQIVTGMTEWCNTNCRLGYCPSSHCICIR